MRRIGFGLRMMERLLLLFLFKGQTSLRSLHSPKLTWKPIKPPLKRTVVFIGPFLGFHVSFREGILMTCGLTCQVKADQRRRFPYMGGFPGCEGVFRGPPQSIERCASLVFGYDFQDSRSWFFSTNISVAALVSKSLSCC